jgi:hypothetical protein
MLGNSLDFARIRVGAACCMLPRVVFSQHLRVVPLQLIKTIASGKHLLPLQGLGDPPARGTLQIMSWRCATEFRCTVWITVQPPHACQPCADGCLLPCAARTSRKMSGRRCSLAYKTPWTSSRRCLLRAWTVQFLACVHSATCCQSHSMTGHRSSSLVKVV